MYSRWKLMTILYCRVLVDLLQLLPQPSTEADKELYIAVSAILHHSRNFWRWSQMRNPTISPRLVHSPDGILPKGCYITGFTNSWYMERFLPLRKYPFLQQPPWLGLFSTNILMADSCEIQNAHFKFYNFTHYK